MRKLLFAVLLIGLAASLAWGYNEWYYRQRLAYALEANYQRGFYQLISNVERSSVSLSKALASGSSIQSILYLTDVWNNTSTAQESISELPFKDVNLSASRKFLSQVGDYSYNLAQASAQGRPLTSGQTEQLSKFYTELGGFSKELHQIERGIAQGGYRWSDVMGGKRIMNVAQAAAPGVDSFINIDKRLQEMPSLVYDGPFSDHLELLEPRGLTGTTITNSDAVERAKSLLALPATAKLIQQQETAGRIPTYRMTFLHDRQETTLDMSKKGGHLVWMLNNRTIVKGSISREEAMKKAADYLAEVGYSKMEPTYSVLENGIWVISLAYTDHQVTFYPDLIKVQVASDQGQVVGVEAMGYLMTHFQRQSPAPNVTEGEARSKVNPALKVEGLKLAMIPKTGGKEVLTWEARARRESDKFLVYINALSGEEERILKIIDLPEGEMAM